MKNEEVKGWNFVLLHVHLAHMRWACACQGWTHVQTTPLMEMARPPAVPSKKATKQSNTDHSLRIRSTHGLEPATNLLAGYGKLRPWGSWLFWNCACVWVFKCLCCTHSMSMGVPGMGTQPNRKQGAQFRGQVAEIWASTSESGSGRVERAELLVSL